VSITTRNSNLTELRQKQYSLALSKLESATRVHTPDRELLRQRPSADFVPLVAMRPKFLISNRKLSHQPEIKPKALLKQQMTQQEVI
jgi:hypothetical protein